MNLLLPQSLLRSQVKDGLEREEKSGRITGRIQRPIGRRVCVCVQVCSSHRLVLEAVGSDHGLSQVQNIGSDVCGGKNTTVILPSAAATFQRVSVLTLTLHGHCNVNVYSHFTVNKIKECQDYSV